MAIDPSFNNETKSKPKVGDGTPGPGRPKGVLNKSTATMKAAIMSVYEALQANHKEPHGHFLEWAQDEPTEFYKLAAKLIPLQVTGEGGGPIAVTRIELVAVKPE